MNRTQITAFALAFTTTACMAEDDLTQPSHRPPLGPEPGIQLQPPAAPPPAAPPSGQQPQPSTCGFEQIEPILNEHCGLCHGATPQYGAPMSLTKYEDLMAPARSNPSRSIHEVTLDRVRASTARMPPTPNAPLSEAQIGKLADWSRACTGTPQPPPNGNPIEEEMGLEPIDILAPDALVRGNTVDEYGCFSMKISTPHTLHAVKAVPIVDEPAVVHHILLFRDKSRMYPEQKYDGCSADTIINRDWELMHGWAPGGTDLVLPTEAGLRIEDGDQFVVQVHYNNPTDRNFMDSSGMRLWVTPDLRPNDSAVVGMGPELFVLLGGQREVTWSGDCRIQEPMHIYGVNPHMHLLGRKAKLELVRGGRTTLVYERTGFSFDEQYNEPLELDVMPGDTLRTTCTWDTSSRDGLVFFGEGTVDEMCYIFVAHYPPIGRYSCN